MHSNSRYIFAVLVASFLFAFKASADWKERLHLQIPKVDRLNQGELGLFVKDVQSNKSYSYKADRNWYLASTVKVPVAVVLLLKQQEGSINLNEEITLTQGDYVDGSGELLTKSAGEKFTIGVLLEKMLTQSDSTAADLLIKKIGVEELNSRLSQLMPNTFSPFTTILQVRTDAYGELHERAKLLTNADFIELKKIKNDSAKLDFLAQKMGVKKSDFKVKSIDAAFEKYYLRNLNSGTLAGFAELIERLSSGKILNTANTALIQNHMQNMITGDFRIKAGLPRGVRFAQKTGTQVRRVCNVGYIEPGEISARKIVITACVEKFDDRVQAEKHLARVGKEISKAFGLDQARAAPSQSK